LEKFSGGQTLDAKANGGFFLLTRRFSREDLLKKCDVLVTGAAGFIGQYMCEHLAGVGISVIGLDKRDADLPCEFIRHDLTQPYAGGIEVDTCIHLASSVGGILYNNAAKADMIEYNASVNTGTVELLKAGGCQRMVFFSSINVFESNPLFEHGPLRVTPALTSYAMSKADGEFVLAEAFKHFTVIRPTNVFGKRQTRTHDQVGESHVIPDLMKKIQENDIVEVLGDGTQLRNFVHVQDIVEFVVRNLNLDGRHYFNLRSDITITIGQLARELSIFMNRNVRFRFDPSFMKLETFKIQNFDLAIPSEFGWSPRFQSITEGLGF
jgi:UDP-glucose 4-epimerase